MKLPADLHISPRTVAFPRSLGHEAVRVDGILPKTASDEEIVAAARDSGSTVLTQDLDFSAIVALSGARTPSLITQRLASSRVEHGRHGRRVRRQLQPQPLRAPHRHRAELPRRLQGRRRRLPVDPRALRPPLRPPDHSRAHAGLGRCLSAASTPGRHSENPKGPRNPQSRDTYRRIRPHAHLGFYKGEEREEDAGVLFASIQTLGRVAHLERFPRDAFAIAPPPSAPTAATSSLSARRTSSTAATSSRASSRTSSAASATSASRTRWTTGRSPGATPASTKRS
jgi:predicted nuclease of predicted toxin-antitoxin system